MDSETIIDFSSSPGRWMAIDDVVMGGVSASSMAIEDGVGIFRGTLSLENGGGFASVRSAPVRRDLSRFDGLMIRARGDGRRYKLRLRTTPELDGVSYEVSLDLPAGEWREIVVPFDAFVSVFRGRSVPDAAPLDPSNLQTFGLMIADRQAGPFRLEVASISGVRSGGA